MKKIIALIMTFSMIFALTACQGTTEGTSSASSSKPAGSVTPEETPEAAAAPKATETPGDTATPAPEAAAEPEKEPDLPVPPSPEEAYAGEWYGSLHGLTMCLDLNEDDSYTVTISALQEEPGNGSWALVDGYIFMDSEEQPSVYIIGEELFWSTPGIYLTREEQESYTPAPVADTAGTGDFDGYWKSAYVLVDGEAVFSDSLGDNTDIYIEGTNVALGGDLFGDVILEFTPENGSLVFSDGSMEKPVKVTIQLQEDSLMRLTLEAGPDEMILILEASETPWEMPEEQTQA